MINSIYITCNIIIIIIIYMYYVQISLFHLYWKEIACKAEAQNNDSSYK